MPSETIGKTIGVATAVCVVCSVFVSTAAVYLKPIQEVNKTLDMRKNILAAAGVVGKLKPADVDELFKRRIEMRVVDLATGEFVEDPKPDDLDEKKAANDPNQNVEFQNDLAGIKRSSKYRLVYLTTKDGDIDRIILPVYGKGLWSTMYGLLALDCDLNTIKSFAFYEHAETPGLGGEVDNPKWKKSWVDKKAFDDTWEPRIEVVKGVADRDAVYQVDGLSGATLTARGVENLVRFWLGEEGYGPFLTKLRAGGNDG